MWRTPCRDAELRLTLPLRVPLLTTTGPARPPERMADRFRYPGSVPLPEPSRETVPESDVDGAPSSSADRSAPFREASATAVQERSESLMPPPAWRETPPLETRTPSTRAESGDTSRLSTLKAVISPSGAASASGTETATSSAESGPETLPSKTTLRGKSSHRMSGPAAPLIRRSSSSSLPLSSPLTVVLPGAARTVKPSASARHSRIPREPLPVSLPSSGSTAATLSTASSTPSPSDTEVAMDMLSTRGLPPSWTMPYSSVSRSEEVTKPLRISSSMQARVSGSSSGEGAATATSSLPTPMESTPVPMRYEGTLPRIRAGTTRTTSPPSPRTTTESTEVLQNRSLLRPYTPTETSSPEARRWISEVATLSSHPAARKT